MLRLWNARWLEVWTINRIEKNENILRVSLHLGICFPPYSVETLTVLCLTTKFRSSQEKIGEVRCAVCCVLCQHFPQDRLPYVSPPACHHHHHSPYLQHYIQHFSVINILFYWRLRGFTELLADPKMYFYGQLVVSVIILRSTCYDDYRLQEFS